MAGKIREESGFSLIEILIVMILIGVLAVIALPSFMTQRSKGQDACARAQLHTMKTAIETLYTETESYEGVDVARLHEVEGAVVTDGACGNGTKSIVGGLSSGNCDTGVPTTAGSYCISQSSASGRSYLIALSDGGAVSQLCAPAGVGCKDGRW